MGFMEEVNKGTSVLKKLGHEDLLPGVNPYLDYICEAILTDSPINDENRWPPERL